MVKRQTQKGSALVIIVSVLAVAIIGVLGFTFWSNYYADNDDSDTNQQTSGTEVAKEEAPEFTYKTYRINGEPISFDYPSAWTVGVESNNDQHGMALRSVDIETETGKRIKFSVGGQVGGYCNDVENAPVRDTLEAVNADFKTPDKTTVSYTVTNEGTGQYVARFGLTDRFTAQGQQRVCENVYYYLFSSGSKYGIMTFFGEGTFDNLQDAKSYLDSDEYAEIKKMMLSLDFPQS